MAETALYGQSHNLSNVRVLKDENHVGVYHVFVDGKEIHGVSELTATFRPEEIPTVDMTICSVTKIDHDVLLNLHIDPVDVRECIKFIALQLQLDKDLRSAWQSSIYCALKELELKNCTCTYDKAGYILDRLMG